MSASSSEKAAKSAVSILSYAPNTEKRLREKLYHKGFSAEDIDFAVDYVKKKGYLNDQRQIAYSVESLATRKLYGVRRIREELYKSGYSRELIDALDFSEYDFAQLCEQYAAKRPNDTPEKLAAALQRHGFSKNEIIAVLKKRIKDDSF